MSSLSFFRRHRDSLLLAACMVTSLALLNSPDGFRFNLARGLRGVMLAPADGVRRLGARLSLLGGENEALRKQLMEFSDQSTRSEELEKEARRLRRLLDFRETQSYSFLPAELLSFPVTFRERNLLRIDRGSKDGVGIGMPVVNPKGLIGMVYSVDERESQVLLLMSKNTAVSCRDRRSRVLGVFKWDARRGFYVDRVDPQEDVRVGDFFMTSGLGVLYPEGFLLGRVTAVRETPGALRQEIFLEAAAPMQTIEDVFVVTEISLAAPGFPVPLEEEPPVPNEKPVDEALPVEEAEP